MQQSSTLWHQLKGLQLTLHTFLVCGVGSSTPFTLRNPSKGSQACYALPSLLPTLITRLWDTDSNPSDLSNLSSPFSKGDILCINLRNLLFLYKYKAWFAAYVVVLSSLAHASEQASKKAGACLSLDEWTASSVQCGQSDKPWCKSSCGTYAPSDHACKSSSQHVNHCLHYTCSAPSVLLSLSVQRQATAEALRHISMHAF
eukprot:1159183-Pelagomonas_calceolata.AAC.12